MQHGLPFGWPRIHFSSIPSTMPFVSQLARAGADHGTVVTTDYQSAGTGRENRPWIAPPGSALLMSVVLKTAKPLAEIPVISMLIAACVSDALMSLGIGSLIKWPNDVLVQNRKISGILVRSQAAPTPGLHDLIVGIGLNLERAASDGISGATNVESEIGFPVSRLELLNGLLDGVGLMAEEFEQGTIASRLAKLEARLAMRGEPVAISDGQHEIRGRVEGLRRDGALILLMPNGRQDYILSGEVQRGPTLLKPEV